MIKNIKSATLMRNHPEIKRTRLNLEFPPALMEGIGEWAGYYRKNPDIFVRDYFNITLKLYQRILLIMMFYFDNFMFLGARGISKTFTAAVFAPAKAVLYPNSKICIASKTLKQAGMIMEKIQSEVIPHSPLLQSEISKFESNSAKKQIDFFNGSVIYAVAATPTSRGNRATVLICDEFVQMKQEIVDTVLRKFLNVSRQVGYTKYPEYADCVERNQEIYLSSCWFKSHWSWNTVRTYAVNMLDSARSTFLCGLPYQLSIKEKLLTRERVETEMSEETFSEMSWKMEMDCLFWGESESAFFKYDQLVDARTVTFPIYPKNFYNRLPKAIKYPVKGSGELRILSLDIAVMASKRAQNDATAIYVLQLIPNKNGQYIRNVVYTEAFEGGHIETQALAVRRLYDQLDCDYIIMDTNGVGAGIYDMLVTDLVDRGTGEMFEALQCMNDSNMADRYKGASPCPPKVIYSLKPNATSNSDCATSLRDAIQRGKLHLPVTEKVFDEYLEEIGLDKIDELLLTEMKMPLVHTTLTINELINLEYTLSGSYVKISEVGAARKDRYSSLSYGNYLANVLEGSLKKRYTQKKETFQFFMRAPEIRARTR